MHTFEGNAKGKTYHSTNKQAESGADDRGPSTESTFREILNNWIMSGTCHGIGVRVFNRFDMGDTNSLRVTGIGLVSHHKLLCDMGMC